MILTLSTRAGDFYDRAQLAKNWHAVHKAADAEASDCSETSEANSESTQSTAVPCGGPVWQHPLDRNELCVVAFADTPEIVTGMSDLEVQLVKDWHVEHKAADAEELEESPGIVTAMASDSSENSATKSRPTLPIPKRHHRPGSNFTAPPSSSAFKDKEEDQEEWFWPWIRTTASWYFGCC
ncbi:unnamed protein product [Cladocopium goreaui]|uniref:Uncharacterized protein n=1 Tax=Cladocopium goreaui TaxID=2562237 RepID=A0A9P1C6C3_9DINO|nr:unnamed protein product [Cladocopium goreaui]|mmetsp:Transcript_69341/g.140438  ORF Transcript_69341/g.140438 Transcript_69341/m.140438 type:complete len:181 (+) Transcript_69341:41-583(+)